MSIIGSIAILWYILGVISSVGGPLTRPRTVAHVLSSRCRGTNLTASFPSTMDMLGLHGGHVRLPLINISDEDKEELEKVVFEKLGLSKI